MPETYRNNHYVPEWYQRRFLAPDRTEDKYHYLELEPRTIADPLGRTHTMRSEFKKGVPSCFMERDLYTTRFGRWESTEIERRFFDKVDREGRNAVDHLDSFTHKTFNTDLLQYALTYMSIQKMRTPKGLSYLATRHNVHDKNAALFHMQQLRNLHCACWTESIWSIADASESATKFIVTDHPVTVYNRDCFPHLPICMGSSDPDIWQTGTHTLFPLSLNKILILTNLSWVRNPYTDPKKQRPNPNPFRTAMFNIMDIQTGRALSEIEVLQINYILKKRAYKYIAAGKPEWLYPEQYLQDLHWRKFGKGYLLMPDPRGIGFSTETVVRYTSGHVTAHDEYGRIPGQKGFRDKQRNDIEWKTSQGFQGEFARLFGAKRRGRSYGFGRLDEDDAPEFHAHMLAQEKHVPKKRYKPY